MATLDLFKNLPVINGSQIEKNNNRIFIERFSVSDEYIGLKNGSGSKKGVKEEKRTGT
jgi:hypothetical protein